MPKTRRTISDEVADQLQARIKAAVYGTDPATWFSRYDKDKEGHLDYDEFKKMVRIGLKVNRALISDADINLLIAALDDDESGTIDIMELADFAERGKDTFFEGVDTEFEGTKWGEKHLSDAEKPFDFTEPSWMTELKNPSPLCRYLPPEIPHPSKALMTPKQLLAFIVDVYDKKVVSDNSIMVEHDKPLIFGADENKGIAMAEDGFGIRVVTIGVDGVTEETAREALYKASAKLPIKTKFIKR